jgi:short chain dehydrogenase
MDEQSLNRRQILGGLAMAAGAAGAMNALGVRDAAAAQAAPAAKLDPSQAPTITTIKDKVIYVTGGSSGIGLGIARAAHEAGARVVLGNLDDKQWADALKNFPANDPRVMTAVHNVMDKDGWQRTADAIEKKFGPVDILINNAGVGLNQSTVTGTLNDWEWGMGPMHSFHACARVAPARTSSPPPQPAASCPTPVPAFIPSARSLLSD